MNAMWKKKTHFASLKQRGHTEAKCDIPAHVDQVGFPSVFWKTGLPMEVDGFSFILTTESQNLKSCCCFDLCVGTFFAHQLFGLVSQKKPQHVLFHEEFC